MTLLNLIEKTSKLINSYNKIRVLKCNFELNTKNNNYKDIENDIGFKLSDEIKEVYNKYRSIHLVWEIEETKENGWFKLIPLNDLNKYYKDNIYLSNEFGDYDEVEKIDQILEDIKNWIPFFTFPNGDAFCIDKRNSKVVFFEHEVFDMGINLHGLVIAKSIEDLIVKWSKVSFIDIYDWCEGTCNEDGIDLSKDIYKNIIKIQ